jgi:hypothetical protein
MSVYIWDNAIVVLAENLEEAREMAICRLANFRALAAMVQDTEPVVMGNPGVRILFQPALNRESLCEPV